MSSPQPSTPHEHSLGMESLNVRADVQSLKDLRILEECQSTNAVETLTECMLLVVEDPQSLGYRTFAIDALIKPSTTNSHAISGSRIHAGAVARQRSELRNIALSYLESAISGSEKALIRSPVSSTWWLAELGTLVCLKAISTLGIPASDVKGLWILRSDLDKGTKAFEISSLWNALENPRGTSNFQNSQKWYDGAKEIAIQLRQALNDDFVCSDVTVGTHTRSFYWEHLPEELKLIVMRWYMMIQFPFNLRHIPSDHLLKSGKPQVQWIRRIRDMLLKNYNSADVSALLVSKSFQRLSGLLFLQTCQFTLKINTRLVTYAPNDFRQTVECIQFSIGGQRGGASLCRTLRSMPSVQHLTLTLYWSSSKMREVFRRHSSWNNCIEEYLARRLDGLFDICGLSSVVLELHEVRDIYHPEISLSNRGYGGSRAHPSALEANRMAQLQSEEKNMRVIVEVDRKALEERLNQRGTRPRIGYSDSEVRQHRKEAKAATQDEYPWLNGYGNERLEILGL